MKSILLINPWIYDFAAYDFWIKPIGLLYIGSFLRENGYEVNLIDCLNSFHHELTNEKIIKIAHRKHTGHGKFPKEEILKPPPLNDIPRKYNRYGISPALFRKSLRNIKRPSAILVTSMMTYWYPGVFESIQIIREEIPGVPIILGGNYATLCPGHALKSGADYVISSSRGEEKISAIFNDIFGESVKYMPDINDLNSYMYPAYDLLPYQDQLPILTSRGCPFRCSYCASHILHEYYHVRDPIKVVDEIEYWHKYLHVVHFSFYDDALLFNAEEMAIPMMKEIIKRKLTSQFHCPNGLHLRYVNEEISLLMYLAGFKTIRLGFESSDHKIQIETGGKVRNSHLEEAVHHLKNAGYQTEDIGVYLLCGMPGQSFSDVRDSIEFVKFCGARPVIAEYSPIPGTGLWDKAVQISPYSLEKEPLFHNNSLLPCQNENLTYAMYRKLKTIAKLK
ncbi:MAG: radical SAM protein [Syntrophaceae bacterium]|nr:radical SAM protein [Syntrophaceae bacterium]